jgi:hypothetical protein
VVEHLPTKYETLNSRPSTALPTCKKKGNLNCDLIEQQKLFKIRVQKKGNLARALESSYVVCSKN